MRKILMVASVLSVSSSALTYNNQLLQAVDRGDAALVSILIDEYGLDVNHQEDGVTALDVARIRNWDYIASMLVMRGAKTGKRENR